MKRELLKFRTNVPAAWNDTPADMLNTNYEFWKCPVPYKRLEFIVIKTRKHILLRV